MYYISLSYNGDQQGIQIWMPHRLKTNQRHGKTQEQNGTDVAFTGDREQGGSNGDNHIL